MSDKPTRANYLANVLRDFARADVGHVILAVAFIELSLETQILAHLPKALSDEEARKLFSERGPFGSLSTKMEYAQALDLVDNQTCEYLKTLNKVRNLFAHPRGFLNFASPEVKKEFTKYQGWKGDTKAVFDELVRRAEQALSAKFNRLIYKDAPRPEEGSPNA